MKFSLLSSLLLITAAAFMNGAALAEPGPTTAPARSRSFVFSYDATVTGLTAGEAARVWLPVPPSNDEQSVEKLSSDVPSATRLAREPKYGNAMIYCEERANAAGEIPLHVRYRVTRREVTESASAELPPEANDPDLQPDRLVPIGGKPSTLLAGKTLPREALALGRALYDLVDDHLTYRKDQPGWGRGDAAWACESGFGNCTDFHSLFISLARTCHLPARFEIGFSIPEAHNAAGVQGYHCWAEFRRDAQHRVPVDIAEANRHPEKRDYYFGHLDANRVLFSVGRDLMLIPQQDGPPLNFFVYPYVEVAGKPWPAERVAMSFAYEDVGAADKPEAVSR